jgi:hypothetical protein
MTFTIVILTTVGSCLNLPYFALLTLLCLKTMSLFSLFGPTIKYPQDKHQITTEQVKHLMWHVHLTSISQANKDTVAEAVLAKRDGEDKTSLQHIYEVLTRLKNENRSTKIDRDLFMKIFVEFFTEQFK